MPIRFEDEQPAAGRIRFADEEPKADAYSAIFPRYSYPRKTVVDGVEQTEPPSPMDAALDLASLPGRALTSLPALLPGGESFTEAMSRTRASGKRGSGFSDLPSRFVAGTANLVEDIGRDPALAPSLAVGGPAVTGLKALGRGKIVSGLGAGLAEGGTSAVIHAAGEPDISAGRVITETLTGPIGRGAGGVLSLAGKGASAVGRGMQEIVPEAQTALKTGQNIAPQTNRFGIEFTPATVSGPKDAFRQSVEQRAQLTPGLSDIPGNIKERNTEAVRKALAEQRGKFPGAVEPGSINMSEAGLSLEQNVGKAKKEIEGVYSEGEKKTIAPVFGGELPRRPSKNAAVQDDLDLYLQSKGYRGGQPTGNEDISENTINFINDFNQKLKNAKNVGDLLNQRRNVQDAIFNGKWQYGQLFTGRDQAAMGEVYQIVNKNIGTAIERQFPGEQGKAIRQAWEANNAMYAENRDILENIDRGMGLSRNTMSASDYFNNLKNVGVENLKKLQAASQKNEALKPVYANMQAGFFDNFLRRSLNQQTMELSPTRLASNWESVDEGIKKAMLGDQVVADMDELIDSVRKLKMTDVEFTNPSGTARDLTRLEGGKLKNMVLNMVMRGPLKDYYATGSVAPVESALGMLATGGRALSAAGAGAQKTAAKLPGMQAARSIVFQPEDRRDYDFTTIGRQRIGGR